jgi:hypothetical protein
MHWETGFKKERVYMVDKQFIYVSPSGIKRKVASFDIAMRLCQDRKLKLIKEEIEVR